MPLKPSKATRNRGLVSIFVLVCAFILAAKAGETVEEAAALARRLVDLSPSSIGTMASVYPSDHPSLPDQPFSLQEYYASCHQNGSLTLLFLPISRHSQNILHSRFNSAAISVWSEPSPAASKPRVSLTGNVTIFRELDKVPDLESIKSCYLKAHPDARWWIPGPREAHVAYWARFDPMSVYFVGGFGGQHFIGYIPPELYREAHPSINVLHNQMAETVLVS